MTTTPRPRPPDHLLVEAHARERDLQGELPNRTGTFYTPPWLATVVAKKALAPKLARRSLKELYRLRLIDPACGSGVMILAALELLAERLLALGQVAELPPLADQIIYGVDRNPAAVHAARGLLARSLAARGLPRAPFERIVCGDTLLDDRGTLFGSDTTFDVVLGNPPYGLSRDEQISAEENAALKKIFERYRTGRINKYLAFMARGYELLNDGGTMTLIVPNSWLGIREAHAIRRLLLSAGELHEVTILPPGTFENLGVETVMMTARRGVSTKTLEVRRATVGVEIAPRRIPLPPSTTHTVIPVSGGRSIDGVWDALDALPPLADPQFGFIPRIALQAYATGKGSPPQTSAVVQTHPFHSREKATPHHLPYLNGKDIGRYALAWSGTYLHYGPWLAEPQRLEYFSGPRIVLREILAGAPYLLRGAFIDTPALYNKSVLHILGGDPTNLRALLGVLNSRLASFVIMTRGRKGSRTLFPKLLNDDLKRFPLPRGFIERAQPLAERVRELELHGVDPARDRALDHAVYALYELAPQSIATIERFTTPGARL